jgi:N-acetylmuramoyl-L-alanine amidase
VTENGLIRPWASMLMALIAACSLVAAAHAPDVGAQEAQRFPLSGKTIVLDPGHGGNDWGARYVDAANRSTSRRRTRSWT